jgi:hypothetical protein
VAELQGATCTAVGTNSTTYVVASTDVGHTIEVKVSATNTGGTSAAGASAATAVVVPAIPAEITAPSITGTTVQGDVLTEHHGTWTNTPTSYAYQWLRCDTTGANCTAIAAATAQTYTLTAADVGDELIVGETASNGTISQAAYSAATSIVSPPLVVAVPVNNAPPIVSGVMQEGQTLVESHGSWSNSPSGYTYQWEDCDTSGSNCSAIPDATGQSYKLTAPDVGNTIRVQETATNAGGTSSPASSAATAAVLPLPPTDTAAPSISGFAQQGQTLSEAHGSWSNGPTGYAYQWEDCDTSGNSCSPIPGATEPTYLLSTEDVGRTVRVLEIADNAGGPGSAAPSPETPVVLPATPGNTVLPSISGSAQLGQTVTEARGSWSNNPTTYSYQWEDCDPSGNNCSAIFGATGEAYNPSSNDIGHTIRVQETASNASGNSLPASSAQTAVVAALTPPTGTQQSPSAGQQSPSGGQQSPSGGQQSAASGTPPPPPAGTQQAPQNVAQVRSALVKTLSISTEAFTVRRMLQQGRFTLSFVAPSPGHLTIGWYLVPKGAHLGAAKREVVLVASLSVALHKAGPAKVKLVLTGAGRRMLKASDRLHLTAEATFTPTGETAMTITEPRTL